MAYDSFDALMKAIGFPAADAAASISRTTRDLDRGVSELALTGETERRGIRTSAESRGVLDSGATHRTLAEQAGSEARRYTDLQLGASDDIAAANQGVLRAIAEEEARRKQQEAADAMRAAGYDSEIGLIGAGRDSDMAALLRDYQAKMDAYAAAAAKAATPVPGFDPYAYQQVNERGW